MPDVYIEAKPAISSSGYLCLGIKNVTTCFYSLRTDRSLEEEHDDLEEFEDLEDED